MTLVYVVLGAWAVGGAWWLIGKRLQRQALGDRVPLTAERLAMLLHEDRRQAGDRGDAV